VVEPKTQAGKTIVPAGTWSADPAHSSVEFKVKHPAMFTTVTGRFANSRQASRPQARSRRAPGRLPLIEATSIDTNQPARDEDLRSPRFFDAATYPQIRFESRRIEHVKEGTFRVVGELTIKDMTRELRLEAIVQGVRVLTRTEPNASASRLADRSSPGTSASTGSRSSSPRTSLP